VTDSIQQALEAMIANAAIAYAHKWRLVDDKANIWCATDRCERLALLPSLHCGGCLGAHYARHHITTPHCINHAQPQAKEVA
jgi:hypothetical protein